MSSPSAAASETIEIGVDVTRTSGNKVGSAGFATFAAAAIEVAAEAVARRALDGEFEAPALTALAAWTAAFPFTRSRCDTAIDSGGEPRAVLGDATPSVISRRKAANEAAAARKGDESVAEVDDDDAGNGVFAIEFMAIVVFAVCAAGVVATVAVAVMVALVRVLGERVDRSDGERTAADADADEVVARANIAAADAGEPI
jgi:hypothetical protein